MSSTSAEQLIQRLVVGDVTAIGAVLEAARESEDPEVLVAAALSVPDREALIARASRSAKTSRERQLVAIAAAHLGGRPELVDALARDHLVDHPDNVLVAWIAGASHRSAAPTNPEDLA
jgi:uncharacterized protein YbaP (TraB family)